MGFTVKDTGSGGGDWEPVPSGVYHAVCYAVVDLGTQFSQMFGVAQRKCWICWEFPNERIKITQDNEEVEKPRVISEFFTVSLHEKSNLRQILESWRGRGFTEQELQGFDISNLIGANAQINVIHKPRKDGKMKAVIGSIMPINKGTKKFDSENEYVYFSFEEHGKEVSPNVPDGIKAMIMRSREWNETGQQQDEWRQENSPLQDSDPWGDSEPPQEPDGLPF